MQRTIKGWETIQGFIPKRIQIPELRIMVLGYFPYHTASINRKVNKTNLFLSRDFFSTLEVFLTANKIADNKAVYICVPMTSSFVEVDLSLDNFAVFLKDDWAIMGTWESVTNYDGTPLKKVRKSKIK